MALVQCVDCDAPISEKAVACPKCGSTEPHKTYQATCDECGMKLGRLGDDGACPECGNPEVPEYGKIRKGVSHRQQDASGQPREENEEQSASVEREVDRQAGLEEEEKRKQSLVRRDAPQDAEIVNAPKEPTEANRDHIERHAESTNSQAPRVALEEVEQSGLEAPQAPEEEAENVLRIYESLTGPSRELYETAAKKHIDGDWHTARVLYRQIIDQFPDSEAATFAKIQMHSPGYQSDLSTEDIIHLRKTPYEDIPIYQRSSFSLLLLLLVTPIGFIYFLSIDIYAKEKKSGNASLLAKKDIAARAIPILLVWIFGVLRFFGGNF